MARARRCWKRRQAMLTSTRLVFIDETAANTKMVRLSGRCPRGERLVGCVPQGHWKTLTFVAGLRRNGMTAPCVIDGSMSGKTFLAYVEQSLAPAVKRKDIVVMDNLPAHKVPGVREAIEARGATLRYLPQYSPDLNPIEMPFSKLKADLRKAAERTVPRLCRRIGSFARRLSPTEAFNYFRHAGYAQNRPESALVLASCFARSNPFRSPGNSCRCRRFDVEQLYHAPLAKPAKKTTCRATGGPFCPFGQFGSLISASVVGLAPTFFARAARGTNANLMPSRK